MYVNSIMGKTFTLNKIVDKYNFNAKKKKKKKKKLMKIKYNVLTSNIL